MCGKWLASFFRRVAQGLELMLSYGTIIIAVDKREIDV